MTDIEKIKKRIELAQEAFDMVKLNANADRKLSHDAHMNGHYTKSLQELEAVINSHKTHLVRLEAIGR